MNLFCFFHNTFISERVHIAFSPKWNFSAQLFYVILYVLANRVPVHTSAYIIGIYKIWYFFNCFLEGACSCLCVWQYLFMSLYKQILWDSVLQTKVQPEGGCLFFLCFKVCFFSTFFEVTGGRKVGQNVS